MAEAVIHAGKKLFGIVRGADGRPKVDDPSTMHAAQINMLTPAERADLGLWNGPLAQDAQGAKRLTRIDATTYRAEDALVAASEVFDVGVYIRLARRVDVPAGGTFTTGDRKWP